VKYVRVRWDWGRRVWPSVVGNGGSRWCAALCGLCELDRVAESLELVDESAGAVLGVLAGGEVVRARVGEHLTSAQGVPDDVQQTVRHRDCGLVRAPASGDLVVLSAEVAGLGSCGGAGRLDQGTSQPLVAGGGAYLAAVTGRLVVTGAQASPRRELSRGGEVLGDRLFSQDGDVPGEDEARAGVDGFGSVRLHAGAVGYGSSRSCSCWRGRGHDGAGPGRDRSPRVPAISLAQQQLGRGAGHR
jgi:hypothetical protein